MIRTAIEQLEAAWGGVNGDSLFDSSPSALYFRTGVHRDLDYDLISQFLRSTSTKLFVTNSLGPESEGGADLQLKPLMFTTDP